MKAFTAYYPFFTGNGRRRVAIRRQPQRLGPHGLERCAAAACLARASRATRRIVIDKNDAISDIVNAPLVASPNQIAHIYNELEGGDGSPIRFAGDGFIRESDEETS